MSKRMTVCGAKLHHIYPSRQGPTESNERYGGLNHDVSRFLLVIKVTEK